MYIYKSVTLVRGAFSSNPEKIDDLVQEVLDKYSKKGYELRNIDFVYGTCFINIIMQKKVEE